MLVGKQITVINVRLARNGYIVETGDPMKGPGLVSETVFVFQTLTAMSEWMLENFQASK